MSIVSRPATKAFRDHWPFGERCKEGSAVVATPATLLEAFRKLPRYRLDQSNCDSDVGCCAGISPFDLPDLEFQGVDGSERRRLDKERAALQLDPKTALVRFADVDRLLQEWSK
jgi:hypothetical protein